MRIASIQLCTDRIWHLNKIRVMMIYLHGLLPLSPVASTIHKSFALGAANMQHPFPFVLVRYDIARICQACHMSHSLPRLDLHCWTSTTTIQCTVSCNKIIRPIRQAGFRGLCWIGFSKAHVFWGGEINEPLFQHPPQKQSVARMWA